jgi:hypothetical protein
MRTTKGKNWVESERYWAAVREKWATMREEITDMREILAKKFSLCAAKSKHLVGHGGCKLNQQIGMLIKRSNREVALHLGRKVNINFTVRVF